MLNQERVRQEAAVALAAASTTAERNRLGQYGTPAWLAEAIVAAALDYLGEQPIRYLEPGFGTGPFYSALLQSAGERIEWATGYETDTKYADLASELWCDPRFELLPVDFVRAVPQMQYNLVVCNPPYIRHHHLDSQAKAELRQRVQQLVGYRLSGLGSLYSYFLACSLAWMSPDAVAAWLLPSEFFEVNYGRHLLDWLSTQVTLLRVHRFQADQQHFADAMVSSSVLFWRNSPPPTGHSPLLTSGPSLSSPQEHSSNDLDSLAGTGSRVHDWFDIRRGIATGANSYFALTERRAQELKIPEEFMQWLLPSPRRLDEDIVQTETSGRPRLKRPLKLLKCDLRPEQLTVQYPAVWEYIEEGCRQGIDQRYLCRHRRPWYRQERREPAPFLCTYMARHNAAKQRSLRFIWNQSSAIAANVYLMLYPKAELAEWLGNDAVKHRHVWEALRSISFRQLEHAGREYGGGLKKIEPKELGRVPLELETGTPCH